MHMQIKITDGQNGVYRNVIEQFILSSFPVLAVTDKDDVLDLVTEAILSTGQIRLGPRPSPESQVAIREVLRKVIHREAPIPFLLAMGSEKPNGSGVDMAEVSALKTLQALQERVARYYKPGIQVNIRIEDASAPHLFHDRPEAAMREAELDSSGFVRLVQLFGLSFINPMRETQLVTVEQFNTMADQILPTMEEFLLHRTKDSHVQLETKYGWSGEIPAPMVEYYMGAYTKLYASLSNDEQMKLLARYFAGALARKMLDMTGKSPMWGNDFLELSFLAPIPGFPVDRALRRIYYRTTPTNNTSSHMPCWRAKGYLSVADSGIKLKLGHFYDELPWTPYQITLEGGGTSQVVQADYVTV